MSALAPGTKLGSYEIVAALGAGGMGEVYRALDPRLHREVALKVLPAALATRPDQLARFEREARTVAALSHPHIVTIHSIEQDGPVRFLTMELVDGQSLDRLVTPGGLPLDRVLDIAIPLADALAAAHERGIVHRDLKPSNVMVTREGRVKVLDFGLAKPVTRAPGGALAGSQIPTVESPISSAGQVVGTVPYMAPEQVRGETVDPRADLFAMGVIMHELLTGRRPFTGATAADVGSAILRDTPPPVRAARPELPRDLDRIIGRCLEKDPERRVQTAKDVRNELELVRRDLTPATAAAPWPGTAAPAARPDAPSAGVATPSVAVLPFANHSRDQEDEYFSDGLADELLNVLARIRGLHVAARTSSSTFKGRSVTIAEVGRALNVASVLEGSVRKAGNRVRIAVQLVKVADGYPLWSETYDRTLDDIFAVQDDIAQAVVKELRTTLLGEAPDTRASSEVNAEVAVAARGRGENTEAHRLYLQGRYLIDRMNPEDVAKGIAYLRQALELDPRHALAWVQLSHAFRMQGGFSWTGLAEGYEAARDAAGRAVALEPGLADGHAAIGQVQMMYDWDWGRAEDSYRRALALAPGGQEGLLGAALLNHLLGRFDLALTLVGRATEQDPLSATCHTTLGRIHRSAGDLPAALEAFQRAGELSPQRILGHFWIAIVQGGLGREDEALAEVLREPAEWARLCALGILHHAAGRTGDGDAALNRLTESHGDTAAYQIAAIHGARRDADGVFEWLERSYAQRDPGLVFARTEPLFRPLHGDSRWAPFMRKLGFTS